jgi:biotin-(acetyl-CoA carboxylase) ligase
VGLNVLRPADDAEVAAIVPAPVFLSDLLDGPSREAILAAILHWFDSNLGLLQDPDMVANAWERRANLAGTPYRYARDSDGVEREGIALRIGPHGTLVVAVAGAEEIVDMADVRVLRDP